ncbi:multiple sugar transport system substrate-binding protein [Microbacterium ginsengiterrae]|uniref:Multiple sugar transport system substrate-binding protein n=1 Tax=Microbacterium ginsengiterrae TaxID=546115 RepID=A0A7W9FAW0_9MICO|nr:extracellular solute-binding protein [Microbacterium ginsengiterrae]MBB5742525.1 multiple sugar transport system substrate-binding protein [Microbacterium ginsengiterrae]
MAINTSRRRRIALSALGAVTAAGLLAGCGSSTPGEAAGDGAGEDGVTTIQFWHRTFTPVENEWYANIVKQFNESQDEIKVVDTEVPADAWDQKMKAAQAAGKAPDVYTHSGSIQDAVNAGQLHDLDSIVPEDALAEIIDAAKPVSELDGTFYAYPLLLEPQTVLFWNKDILEAAGVDAENGPETWEELMAACEKIAPTLEGGQYCISPAQDAPTFAWSSVGQQYNFTGHTALNDDWTAPNIDDDGYRAMMEQYKALWDNGYMPKQPLAAYVEAKDFGEEKVAFKVSGSWMMSEVGSDYPDLLGSTGIGAFPNAPGADGRTATTLGNFKWVVDAKSKNAEAAGEFLSWAIAGDPENLVPFFVDTQFTKVPVRQSVQDAVADDSAAADAPWSDVIVNDIAPTAIPEPTYPWDVSLAVGTAFESVMKGSASTDDAIKTAEQAIQTVIDRDGLADKAPSN